MISNTLLKTVTEVSHTFYNSVTNSHRFNKSVTISHSFYDSMTNSHRFYKSVSISHTFYNSVTICDISQTLYIIYTLIDQFTSYLTNIVKVRVTIIICHTLHCYTQGCHRPGKLGIINIREFLNIFVIPTIKWKIVIIMNSEVPKLCFIHSLTCGEQEQKIAELK